MAKSGYKGISRIDQPSRNTYGWYVRVMFNAATRCKFFSDKASGSKRKALEAAIKYRDQAEKELGRPRTDRLVSSGSRKNESGVTGVNIKKQVVKTGKGEEVINKYYVVTWHPWPGKTCAKMVSIEKYGERGALLKACQIRREKEREMYGSEVKANWRASFGKLVAV
jgi:hypothetical protein